MSEILAVNIESGGYPNRPDLLRNIHFNVKAGELVGLIGANGAGKSSTIKGILGILENLKGEIKMDGYAYIPERPVFYENMTLWEHCQFLQSTLSVNEVEFFSRTKELLAIFGLGEVVHQYPQSYSKGMQQKGIIVLALLKQADLYIIDEPFMGLDPKATKKLLQILEAEKARGAGILMSTHVLDTAEKICDRFVLISGGTLLVAGDLEVFREKSGLPEGDLLDCFDLLTGDIHYE
ncbi:MAG: ABC transporter ATP-binding protein [Turicibacter sp.]|nr:ABC transporter ATP-binding protein [Turicibacter sp.]